MPTYDYVCRACEHRFEHFQSLHEPTLRKCPECGRLKLERLIGAGAGILFKGSGFYETDYKRKSPPAAGSDGAPQGDAARKADGGGAGDGQAQGEGSGKGAASGKGEGADKTDGSTKGSTPKGSTPEGGSPKAGAQAPDAKRSRPSAGSSATSKPGRRSKDA